MNKVQGFILLLAIFMVALLGQYFYSYSFGSEYIISNFVRWPQSDKTNHTEIILHNFTKEYHNSSTQSSSIYNRTQIDLVDNDTVSSSRLVADDNVGRHLKHILSLTFNEETGVPKVDKNKSQKKKRKPAKPKSATTAADIHDETFWQTLASRDVPGVDCDGIIKGNATAASLGKMKYSGQSLQLEDNDIVRLVSNCSDFRIRRGYVMESIEEERDFPIAYSILTYKDLEQTERLLRAVYRPHNFYCMHLERTSPENMYRALDAIASCLPNVILLPTQFHVARYLMSVIQPELECMRYLWSSPLWKYFINLTGQEFPIATNLELVRMLKSMGDRNDIYGYHMKKSKWEWRIKHKFNGFKKTSVPKPGPPHGITLYKGPVHIAANRAFVDAILHNEKVDDFLGWLLDTRTPDESFFPTLNYNAHLGIQGAYNSLGEAKEIESRMPPIRFKQFYNIKRCPKNKITHDVCIIGTRLLPAAVTSGAMFANKFHTNYESVAYACLEQWHYNKILKERSAGNV